MLAAGLLPCKCQIDRRIDELERGKRCLETGPNKEVHAILTRQLRLDAMANWTVREAARKVSLGIKNKKLRVEFAAAAAKQRLDNWKLKKKAGQPS